MYCLNMLRIALELAQSRPVYEDIASKFFEHFLWIGNAINEQTCAVSGAHTGLWSEEDKFYYDVLHTTQGGKIPLKVESFVGLIPLFAVELLEKVYYIVAHLYYFNALKFCQVNLIYNIRFYFFGFHVQGLQGCFM